MRTTIYVNEAGEYLMMSETMTHTQRSPRYYYTEDINKATIFHPGKRPQNFPKQLIELEAVEHRQVRLVCP